MKEIYERRSIRKYKDIPVLDEDILKLIDAARMAPSSKNRQPWYFVVYENKEKENLLNRMEEGICREKSDPKLPGSGFGLPDAENTLRIMRQAPAVILIYDPEGFSPFESLDADSRFREINSTLSVGAAVENMLLTAQELGLGTLWIGNTCFAYDELNEYTGMSGQLIGAVAVGYSDESPRQRPRKKTEEIVEFRR